MAEARAWLAMLVATWFGCGRIPVAPGTAGSLGALAVAMALAGWHDWRAPQFGWLAVAALVPAIWAADAYAARKGEKDPQSVVVDEVVGQWITLAGATTLNWKSWLAALVVFRVLDIVKPPPARRAERLASGAGIVADDVIAGLYGALVLFFAGWFNLY